MLLYSIRPLLRPSSSTTQRYLSTCRSIPPLIGSAPYYPRHLIIHVPHSSKTWPSHLESTSQLYSNLSKRWSKLEGFKELGFAFSEGDIGDKVEMEWDSMRNRFHSPLQTSTPESYSATLYPDFIPIPSLSISTLSKFEQFYLSLPPSPPSSPSTTSQSAKVDIYVCTHGSRDCRCGELGEPLYQSILKEVGKRDSLGSGGGERVRVRRISHIGGHKYAGNVLVYRGDGGGCDWYGLLRDSDATKLVDYAIGTSTTDPWYEQWRGRLNFPTESVKSEYLSNTASNSESNSKSTPRVELGEEVELKFVSYEGEEFGVKGFEGENLMQVAKRNDLPSILATCGGNCECATCHVHIPPLTPSSPTSSSISISSSKSPLPVPEEAPLPELRDEEDEQLDFALGANENSRLACQILVTKELGDWIKRGGRIKLPQY